MSIMFPYIKPPAGTQINPLHPLSQGLMGCWLFNEGVGSLANDISGNKNHGRLTNMAPNVQGSGWGGSKFGGSLKFDGVNDHIDCGNDVSLNITSNITMAARIKFTSVDTTMVLNRTTGLGQAGYEIYVSNGTVISRINSATGAISPLEYNDNNCHSVVGIYNGTQNLIYVDGTLVANETVGAPNSNPSASFQIGARVGGLFFNGIINSVRIYNRALSAEEVKTLYLDPFCNMMIRRPSGLYVPAAPVGAIMNQFQGVNLGADLYNGVLA